MKKKKTYEKLMCTPVAVEAPQFILAGSLIQQNVEFKEVNVHEFENDSLDGFEVKFD